MFSQVVAFLIEFLSHLQLWLLVQFRSGVVQCFEQLYRQRSKNLLCEGRKTVILWQILYVIVCSLCFNCFSIFLELFFGPLRPLDVNPHNFPQFFLKFSHIRKQCLRLFLKLLAVCYILQIFLLNGFEVVDVTGEVGKLFLVFIVDLLEDIQFLREGGYLWDFALFLWVLDVDVPELGQ